MRLRLFAPIALLAFGPLAACSTVEEAVRGPQLAPVGYPAALSPANQAVLSSARDGIPSRPAPIRCGARARAPSSSTSAPARWATS